MTGIQTQIVRAYEDIHLSIEDIAAEMEDLSVLEIKACLMQFSSVYREAIKTEEGASQDFTDDEEQQARRIMINIMEEAAASDEDKTTNRNLAFRIAKFVRNDKKGRLDKSKGFNTLNVGVAIFNQQLSKMDDAIRRIPVKSNPDPAPQTIDVSSTVEQEKAA